MAIAHGALTGTLTGVVTEVSKPKVRRLKKTIYTLNVNDYEPEITAFTYPLLMQYAEKIDADFFVIRERKYPDWPIDYEKMQIHELGREHGNDWNIYIDSDCLVHPDFFDLTNFIAKDTVLHNGIDMANTRFKYDQYFWRDGRNIGSCNWFAIGSDWCIDLWRPFDDLTLQEAVANIYPLHEELLSTGRCQRAEHLITDYCLARNIARFGLKLVTTQQIQTTLSVTGYCLHHEYQVSTSEKITKLKEVLKQWKIPVEDKVAYSIPS